ncbi:MAG: hypothetical protein ACJ72F_02460, partial [Nitrososphaeraceae archaeon]
AKIKKYNKIDGLKKELSALYLQKYTLNQVCFRQNQAVMSVTRLQTHGKTEDRMLYMNSILENNGYNNNINIKPIS